LIVITLSRVSRCHNTDRTKSPPRRLVRIGGPPPLGMEGLASNNTDAALARR